MPRGLCPLTALFFSSVPAPQLIPDVLKGAGLAPLLIPIFGLPAFPVETFLGAVALVVVALADSGTIPIRP